MAMLLVLLLSASLSFVHSASSNESPATAIDEVGEEELQLLASDPLWNDYKKQFHKQYESHLDEAKRYKLFKESLARIERLNRINGHIVFGLNPSSDRMENEKWARGAVFPLERKHKAPVLEDTGSAVNADKLDWRLTPAVTPVKNQGQCGSCWAFSVAETVESAFILQMGKDTSVTFSPQQIASCVAVCDGCAGGNPEPAYEYLQTVPGLASSWFWPYAQGLTPAGACTSKSCTQSCSAHDVSVLQPDQFYIGAYATITGFAYATPPCSGACLNQNLQKLASSLQQGPVSVCVNAGVWNDYKGGVMTAAACGGSGAGDLDHCVQLVGYDTTAPEAYWIVRNSWDSLWGMDGYIHLEYNANTCGIADEATVPTIGNTPADASDAKARREAWFRIATQTSPDAELKPAATVGFQGLI